MKDTNRKAPDHLTSELDTQESRNSDFSGLGKFYFLTLGFKDVILEACATKAKSYAIQKMREDPSEPPYRWRLQTTLSCFGQKPW